MTSPEILSFEDDARSMGALVEKHHAFHGKLHPNLSTCPCEIAKTARVIDARLVTKRERLEQAFAAEAILRVVRTTLEEGL